MKHKRKKIWNFAAYREGICRFYVKSEKGIYMQKRYVTVIWSILLGFFIFHGVLEDAVPVLSFFDECIGLLCIPFAIYDIWKNRKENPPKKLCGNRRLEFIFLVIFLVGGMLGNMQHRFQPVWIMLVSAVLSTKFFLILLTAGFLQRYAPIDLQEQELTVEILSILWFGYYGLAWLFRDYMVMPESWDICAKASLLFAMLIFCNHRRVWLYRISLMLMVVMLILSGKEKSYGAILAFAVLYYLVVHKKVQTKLRYILYMAVPIVLLAWDKIYYYYVQGHGRYAKSIMTGTALQIAKDYFPIGTGFGTFGSTYAAKYYSPVYHIYGIADNPELGEQSKMYLTDVFWPILLGENGVLGTAIYCGLLLLLFIRVQRVFYYHKRKYLLLIYMLTFMMMTTFSEAGFMQPVVMVYAFVMGTLLEEYETKRNQKMKYFNLEGIK